MSTKSVKANIVKQVRLFDIQSESERIAKALASLKESEKPGEASGMGTKTVILLQQETAIKELYEAGYTVQQIAKALSNDTFGILPKSITQLLNKHATSRRKQAKRIVKSESVVDDKTLILPFVEPEKTTNKQVLKKQVTQITDVE